MKSAARPNLFLLLALLAIAGCSVRGEGDPSAGKPPVAVDVQKAAPTPRTEVIEVVGSLSPKFEAQVKTEYTGLLEKVYVDQWVHVSKGQPLGKLDSREAEVVLKKAQAGLEAAKAAALQAEVQDRYAERELQRTLQLKTAGLATQQHLDDARTNREAAQAALAAARGQTELAEEEVRHAETRLDKAIIRSPLDGVVAERIAGPGDLVGEPGSAPAFRIVDNRVLNVTVNVPSGKLAALSVGQALEFVTDAYPGKTFTGQVMFINPAVDPQSRTVKVVAEVSNSDDLLRGGLFVRGRIITGRRSAVLQIPRQALMTWDLEKASGTIFVVDQDVARLRQVKTGSVQAETVEIASGLVPGELTVIRGGFNLKDNDRVTVARILGE